MKQATFQTRDQTSHGKVPQGDQVYLNIFDVSFQQELRVFCHYYQIPFLDDNVPKTLRNATKIYFSMLIDGVQMNEKFRGSQLEYFFTNVHKDEISDEFDPFKIKDKWMKFFSTGIERANLHVDTVLKNDYSDMLSDYIND